MYKLYIFKDEIKHFVRIELIKDLANSISQIWKGGFLVYLLWYSSYPLTLVPDHCPQNFFMKRQKFVGSDSATKFEAMTSTIISSEKKAAFSL